MSKQPSIPFPRGVEKVEGRLPNGAYYKFVIGRRDDFLEIEADTPDLRRELLLRGGIEMIDQTWYLGRDRSSLPVPQWDGTMHNHTAMRSAGVLASACRAAATGKTCTDEACQHCVTCNSPACQRFLAEDWRRGVNWEDARWISTEFSFGRGAGGPSVPLPIASPSPETRPLTTPEYAEHTKGNQTRVEREARQKEFAEMTRAMGAAIRGEYSEPK
jgi:hypothetical protein